MAASSSASGAVPLSAGEGATPFNFTAARPPATTQAAAAAAAPAFSYRAPAPGAFTFGAAAVVAPPPAGQASSAPRPAFTFQPAMPRPQAFTFSMARPASSAAAAPVAPSFSFSAPAGPVSFKAGPEAAAPAPAPGLATASPKKAEAGAKLTGPNPDMEAAKALMKNLTLGAPASSEADLVEHALKRDDPALLDQALAAGFDVNAPLKVPGDSDASATLIWRACSGNAKRLIARLITLGANLDATALVIKQNE